MKKVIVTFIAMSLISLTSYAQIFSRLHVKTSSSSTVGITTGTSSNKVVGIIHDGTSGVISTTTVNGLTGSSPLKFATAGLTRLTIFENGYVGINVTGTPSAELTVNGKIHAKEVKVNVTAGQVPDYLFLPAYRLRPLSEVSQYISTNGHLPDVPSAGEFERDGLNAGEMNMLLLKKIEELTLYVIEQNGRLQILTERLKAQEEEIKKLQ